MYKVIKRDGTLKEFDITKIVNAIKLAFEAKNKDYVDSTIDFLALKVTDITVSQLPNNVTVALNATEMDVTGGKLALVLDDLSENHFVWFN